MAFSSDVVWEVRTTGLNTNGGGFAPISNTPGTDYSQQTSPQVSYTDLVIGATNTTCTSVGNPFTSAHVGNIINIASGTGFTVQRVQVISVVGGVATVDKALGTASSTGGHGSLGGCLNQIGQTNGAMTLAVAGNTIWVKATASYSVTATQSASNAGSSGLPIVLAGYNNTRGDNGQVTVTLTASAGAVISLGPNFWRMYNFIVNGNSNVTSGGHGIGLGNNINLGNVFLENVNGTQGGYYFTGYGCTLVNCNATSMGSTCPGAFYDTIGSNLFIGCRATGNSCSGFVINRTSVAAISVCFACIADNNTGSSSDGFQIESTATVQLWSCIAYNNGRDGLHMTAAGGADIITVYNCIFVDNAGFGVNQATENWNAGATAGQVYYLAMNFNAYYNNTSGAYSNLPAGPNDITLTGDPFVAGTSNNFALNQTAGAGAACVNAGYPGLLQLGGSGGLALGALQPSLVFSLNVSDTTQVLG